ncbi:MAG: hypothetical protein AAGA26_08605 [Pseudomonadota bacterium]
MSHFAYAALATAFTVFATLFLAINGGLRVIPAGRKFLEEARRRGQLVAPLSLSAPISVILVFVFAGGLAAFAGLVTWVAIRAGLR